MTIIDELPERPGKSKIEYSIQDGKLIVRIPQEGFSLRGTLTLGFIVFWMFMIMIWSTLLIQFGWVWLLASLPFWAMAVILMVMAIRVIFSSQVVEVDHSELLLLKTSGGKTAHASFNTAKLHAISLVEGTYKTLFGISRRGTFPAIIFRNEAFGFGERCMPDEKFWLVNLLNSFISL